MTNIVERLRVTHQVDTGNGYYETVRDPLRTEAADLIESLQARVKELETISLDLQMETQRIAELEAKVVSLRREGE